jgi:hypothetical protein
VFEATHASRRIRSAIQPLAEASKPANTIDRAGSLRGRSLDGVRFSDRSHPEAYETHCAGPVAPRQCVRATPRAHLLSSAHYPTALDFPSPLIRGESFFWINSVDSRLLPTSAWDSTPHRRFGIDYARAVAIDSTALNIDCP